ncbi:VanZ family protein [Mariniflexile sp.]|uniref:VanZ family protein n=1 Tax=Mariniflexile sp. TaxID=1979402 RepID=UPI003561EB0C
MTIKHLLVLKKVLILISILYSIALTVVCLIKINNLPNAGVSFGDKIFHALAYTLLSFLWYVTLKHRFLLTRKRALIYASLFSIIFGIVIEVLQGTLTASRSADIYDVVANTIGVFITILVVLLKKNIPIKN